MLLHKTIPDEPNDWDKKYKNFLYRLKIFCQYDIKREGIVDYNIADLTKYYKWGKKNNLIFHHTVLILPNPKKNNKGSIWFLFLNQEDQLAFKLKWL